MKNSCFLCVVFCLLCSPLSYADSTAIDEFKIKAGYLFNFTKFITWSDENTETFNICILGNDPFGATIDPIEQQSAFNHPIKLFRLAAIKKGLHCHIVYVGAGVNVKSAGLNDNNSLTAGEDSGFITQGGMIAFVKRQDKIKLQINLKLLQQQGLKISAKLLEVAEVVEGEGND